MGKLEWDDFKHYSLAYEDNVLVFILYRKHFGWYADSQNEFKRLSYSRCKAKKKAVTIYKNYKPLSKYPYRLTTKYRFEYTKTRIILYSQESKTWAQYDGSFYIFEHFDYRTVYGVRKALENRMYKHIMDNLNA